MMGFLTHSGYSHGGNGYEGIAFLLDAFAGAELANPGDPGHALDLKKMATDFAIRYRAERVAAKEAGDAEPRAIPGVNHPIFRGEMINFDPRERLIARTTEQQGEYNIFH